MLRIEPYIPGLYRFAVTLCNDGALAEDLTQETLLRAWKAGSQPDHERAVRSWLLTILRNLWIDHCRSPKNRPAEAHSPDELFAETRSPVQLAIENEQFEAILQRMLQLPERQRQVLLLHAVEELTIDEVSGILQISRSAVKASLSVARKTMRQWRREHVADDDERPIAKSCGGDSRPI